MKSFLISFCLFFVTNLWAGDTVFLIASDSIPPYVMAGESVSAELPGMQVEIIDASFAKVGIKTRWKTMPNNRLVIEYRRLEIDAAVNLPGVSQTETFSSDEVVAYRNCVIGPQNLAGTWRKDFQELKILAFQTAKIGFTKAFGGIEALTNHKNYHEVPSQKTIVYHAVNERADLVLSDALVFSYYAKTYFKPQYEKSNLKCLFEIKTPHRIGFKQQKTRDLFNQGLKKLKDSGQYDVIVKKYNQLFGISSGLESSFNSNLFHIAVAH